MKITKNYNKNSDVTLFNGDTLKLLKQIPDKEARLIITSPPYNIGKEYEKVKSIENYLKEQEEVIKECIRIMKDDGSICWQVGNLVNGEVFPLDILLYPIFKKHGLHLRNRIVWAFWSWVTLFK